MLSLKVSGDYRGSSGYDRLTRALVRELVHMGVAVELRQLSGFSIAPAGEDLPEFFDRLTAPVDARAVLHICMPPRAEPEVGKHNFNYTMFEMSRIPDQWVRLAANHRLTVVPTEHCRMAWVNSGVPERSVAVSPQGVDVGFFSEMVEPLPLAAHGERTLASFRFRFLNVAEITLRKNQVALLRAWMRATTPDDDAILILKASAPRGKALTDFYADVRDMLAVSGLSFERAAPVRIMAEMMPDKDLRSLYQACSHYISYSHGEGWDLPMMEAAVSGLSLIAPAHTAYLSYLDSTSAHLLPATLAPMRYAGRATPQLLPHYQGLSWWDPDEGHTVDLLRGIIRGEIESPASPRELIAGTYSWSNAAHHLLRILGECQ